MRKFLSALLSLVIVFNCAFSAVKADTTGNSGNQNGSSTTVDVGEDVENVKSPAINAEPVQDEQKLKNDGEYADEDVVRISIVLKSPSTLEKYSTEDIDSKKAIKYRESLQSKQDKVTAKINRALGEELDVKWNLTLVANVISAEVKYGDIEKIAKLSDVKELWIENQYQPEEDADTTISTGEMTFAQYCWANGYTGAGQIVAIIDTGTNQDHISFDGDALAYSLTKDGKSLSDYDLLTKEDIEKVADRLNATKKNEEALDLDSVYESLKIPFAYNYVDHNYNTDHLNDSQGEHGSHVSGIAAANRYVKVDGQYVDALNSVYAVGVAPDAQILTMKVFGENGGAVDSDYMAAIEDAIILGADSCNLSLGSGNQGFSFTGYYQTLMDKLVENQTAVVNSAGNSYNYSYFAENDCEGGYLYYDDISFATTGSPGTFVNSFSVAAADNIGSTGAPLVFNGNLNVFFAESEGYTNKPIINSVGEYEYVYIDSVGTTQEITAVNSEISLEGKVVIVNRGTTSFYEKGNAIGLYKPSAIVCANNKAGELNMNLQGYSYEYPFVSITLSDAEKIKTASTETTVGQLKVYTGKVEVTDKIVSGQTTERENATLSEFSSWGIPGSLTMKPEIVAPGGNIYSVNGMTNTGYELMSGTSMAAPHITGMVALLAQYVEENGLAELTNGNQRTLINSLLMSTSTPMFDADGNYYPVLRQGSGLADVLAATKSLSFITMNEDATASYADGKVKAELGDDPDRKGLYTYSFNVTNFSDQDLVYELSTDVFSQQVVASKTYAYLSPNTWLLDADVTYEFSDIAAQHDVDRDGDTDTDDAQALLDYITGVVDGKQLDLAAGEMDGKEGITSYDAELLLEWINNATSGLLVPAGETRTVKVTIQLNNKETLDQVYVNGAYVEGYTYLDCTSETKDGEILDVQKSIPFIGFYGKWTDASMYDTSVVEQYYVGEKPYTGVTSNYMSIKYPGEGDTSVVIGNPYAIEDTFPTDRLAISGKTTIVDFKYSLIRNAGTVGTLAYKTDENGTVGDTLFGGPVSSDVYAAYYYVDGGVWRNTTPISANVGKTVAELGLVENDMFNIGVYAVPEYYAMDTKGTLDQDAFQKLVKSGKLGAGSELGFTFTVDNTAPVVKKMELNEDKTKLTVTVSDNRYVAYVALLSMDGKKVYDGVVPEQTEAGQECTVEFDLTELADEKAAVLFVGDYAANEIYRLVKLAETGSYKMTAYFLTDKLEVGHEYIIANINTAGEGYAMLESSYGQYTDGVWPLITVSEDAERGLVYISEDKQSTKFTDAGKWNDKLIWLAKEKDGEIVLVNKYYEDYLSATEVNKKVQTFKIETKWYADENGALKTGDWFLNFVSKREWVVKDTLDTPVYLFGYSTYEESADFNVADEVVVSPETTTLILGVKETAELSATVNPVYLEDRTVTWKSSDENVATVDANGVVTAKGIGEAVITATSNLTPTVSATATVRVVDSNPMDAEVNAQIMVGSDVQFVKINLNDMSTTVLGNGAVASNPLVGGGRDGNYIYGVDSTDDVWAYDVANNYSGENLFAINSDYIPLDGANFPQITNGAVSSDFDLTGFNESGMFLFYDMIEGNLSYFDVSGTHATGVAIAYVGYNKDSTSGTVSNIYYVLTADGQIYLWRIFNSGSNLNARLGKICDVEGLSLDSDLSAFSMTYARAITGEDALFISDNKSQSIFYVALPTDDSTTTVDATYVGTLKNSSHISTLYDDTFDAVSKINSVVEARLEKCDSAELEAVNVNLKEHTSAAKAEYAPVSSDFSAAKLASPLNRKASVSVEAEAEGSQVKVVEYTQDVDANNGLITLTYDNTEVQFIKAESDVEFTSVNDEDGTIKFAYAQTEAVKAGDTVVKFYFAATCEDSDVKVVTNEVNDELNLSEEAVATLDGIGHLWKLSGFVWSKDNKSAKAEFVCERFADHKLTLDAKLTEKVVKQPTYEEKGEKEITATVTLDGKQYTDSKTVAIDKLVPDTGDHSNIVLWTTVAVVSMISIVFAALMKRKAVKR